MSTGQDIVIDALEEIGVRASEAAIQADDIQLGIRKLNDMLIEWEDSGTILGFSPIANETDEVRIPRGARNAVVMNLAGRLCVPFKKPLTAELIASIKSSTDALLRMTVKLEEVEKQGTVPRGTGNDNLYSTRFYADPDKANF